MGKVTVGELIKELQKYPKETKVHIVGDGGDVEHEFTLRDVKRPLESDITDVVLIYTETISN